MVVYITEMWSEW